MKSKRILIVLFICLLQTIRLFAFNETDTILKQKQCFYNAKTEIENMLSGKIPLSYEKAVFIMENAYLNNEIDYDLFKNTIDFYTNNIITLAEANRNEKAQDFKQKYLEVTTEEQKKDRYNKLLYNWAIYTFMTDTTFIIDSNFIYYHLPYEYSYTDPMATINWENSQVLNLLNTRKANCFALASLFKIFAERLKTDANLGLAPGHIYITHSDVKGITYNVELASRKFPGAGSIMTLTYSTIDAVQSGIAMRTLDLKQSVALCLIYLAKGYEHKFNTKTDNFLYQCAETTLRYDSLNLNAMLLKAEVLEEIILNTKKTITQLQKDKQFKEYEKLIAKLYVQGYRKMPIDMKNLIVNRLQKDSVALVLTDHTAKGFKTINPKDDRYASLSWGMFDEEQAPKQIEQYNRVLFNTKTKKITKFVSSDILYNQYNFDPVVAAWQIDPRTKKYSDLSPYCSFENNPISIIDKGGDTSIYYSQDCKLLFRSDKDGLPTALVIVNDKNLIKFTAELGNAKHNKTQDLKKTNEELRKNGKAFDIAAWRKFYVNNTKKGIDNINQQPDGKSGRFYDLGVFNESGVLSYEKDGLIKPGTLVSKGGPSATSYPNEESNKGIHVGKGHDHPNEGIYNFDYGPSGDADLPHKGKLDIIVGRENLYFYGTDMKDNVLKVDKKTLDPKK